MFRKVALRNSLDESLNWNRDNTCGVFCIVPHTNLLLKLTIVARRPKSFPVPCVHVLMAPAQDISDTELRLQ